MGLFQNNANQPQAELLMLEACQYVILCQGHSTYFICPEEARRYAHKVLKVDHPLPIKTLSIA